jgi:maltose alpha-D-glucosyltransferase/alpha-amylase
MLGVMNYPAWLATAAVYQVYVSSFADSNHDGIGDLQGLIGKLDYIQALGCNTVWLNPVFVSPFRDGGYDLADFDHVDPRYGSDADLRQLFNEAHQRGMRVLLDLVAGHVSDTHPWFIDSAQGTPGPYRDWFIWTDSVLDTGTKAHQFVVGHSQRDGCFMANFFYHQPALNYGWEDPDPAKPWQQGVDAPGPRAVRAELERIMRHWLQAGCDGFRVDMASSLVKCQSGTSERGNSELWRTLRASLERDFPDCALVSEWSWPEKAINAGFHLDFLIHFNQTPYLALTRPSFFPPQIDEAILHPNGKGDIRAFLDPLLRQLQLIGDRGLISLPTGNHDFCRLAYGRSPADLRVALAALLTLPGVPVIYYGDEIGMREVPGLSSKEGSYWRTGCRTPMQWNNSANAGFSSAPAEQLYLPVDPQSHRPDVADQEQNPNSLLHLVRRILLLRHHLRHLGNSSAFRVLHGEAGSAVLAWQRGTGSETVIVVINPAGRSESVDLALPGTTQLNPLINEGIIATCSAGGWQLNCAARGFALFIPRAPL